MARIGLPKASSHKVSSHKASSYNQSSSLNIAAPIAPTPLTPPELTAPLYQRGRTVVMIDGNSLFYSASQLKIEIDYLKLINQLTQGGQLFRALFYTGIDSQNEKQKRFLHWMRCHGFRVIDKEVNRFPDGSKKANLEVEMAIDMMQLARHCDTVVLVSGNGELAYALDSVSKQGVHVEVVSLRSMLSDRLRDICDFYTDLGDLQEAIWQHRPVVTLAA
jgi:uncharacterized LabA/DUF88 family protein